MRQKDWQNKWWNFFDVIFIARFFITSFLQVEDLGEAGLALAAEKIGSAVKSQRLPPSEVLSSIPVADADLISYRNFKSFNYTTKEQPCMNESEVHTNDFHIFLSLWFQLDLIYARCHSVSTLMMLGVNSWDSTSSSTFQVFLKRTCLIWYFWIPFGFNALSDIWNLEILKLLRVSSWEDQEILFLHQ